MSQLCSHLHARRLVNLSLANNQLTGPLSPAFSQFSALQQLNLSGNDLNGTLPVAWASFGSGGNGSTPVSIALDRNNLTGPLPDAWASGTLMLQSLNASSNQLSGVCARRRATRIARCNFA